MVSGAAPPTNEKLNTVTLKSLPAGNKENDVWHDRVEACTSYPVSSKNTMLPHMS